MPPGIERAARRAPRPSLAPLLLVAAAGLIFQACATVAPPAPPQTTAALPSSQASELSAMTSHLAERDRALVSLQTAAIMEYTAPDRHAKARENITVSRPASLRVEAMSPFGVVLIVATHGGQLEIFEPSKNKLIRAAANAATLDQFVEIPMEPADAVTLLLGIAPGTERIAASAPAAISTEHPDADSIATMTVGAWRDASGGTSELGFEDGNLAMVRRRDASGQIAYEVRYRDYHDIGGVMFPYAIEADFPPAQSHLTIRYDRPIVNSQIPPAVFDLAPPT